MFVLFNCRNITVPVSALCQYHCSIAAKITVIICASVLYCLLSVHISARSKYFAIVVFYKSELLYQSLLFYWYYYHGSVEV